MTYQHWHRNGHTALCEGLAHCDHCGGPMVPSRSAAGGGVGICDRPPCRPAKAARIGAASGSTAASSATSTRGTGKWPAAAAPARPVVPAELPEGEGTDVPEVRHRADTAKRLADRAAAVEWAKARIERGDAPNLLNLLVKTHVPRRKVLKEDGTTFRRAIALRTEMPPIVDAVWKPNGYAFDRAYEGPVCVLDRTAAWVSAFTTVRIAHGQLEHTGPIELPERGELAPGYYEVRIERWHEGDRMPSPLPPVGRLGVGDTVWVAEPLARLLHDLARDGRWGAGAVDVVDSYTCPDAVKLNEGGWADAIRDIREWSLATFGKESTEYRAVKDSYSQAVSIIHGENRPGAGREYKTGSAVHRDDIADSAKTMHSVTIWRQADQANRLSPDRPIVSMRNTDEVVIPADALAAMTTDHGKIRGLKIDETGVRLGTYKTKHLETWSAA